MSKHTKGPWSIDQIAENSDMYPDKVGPTKTYESTFVLDSTNDRCIAVLSDSDQDLNTDLSEQELEANARLIAAAPELLEALKQLIEELPDKGIVTQLTLRGAIRAIDKAEGSD